MGNSLIIFWILREFIVSSIRLMERGSILAYNRYSHVFGRTSGRPWESLGESQRPFCWLQFILFFCDKPLVNSTVVFALAIFFYSTFKHDGDCYKRSLPLVSWIDFLRYTCVFSFYVWFMYANSRVAQESKRISYKVAYLLDQVTNLFLEKMKKKKILIETT